MEFRSTHRLYLLSLFSILFLPFQLILLKENDFIVLKPVNFSKIKIKFEFSDKDPLLSFGTTSTINKDQQLDLSKVRDLLNQKFSKLQKLLTEEQNGTSNNNETSEIVLLDSFTIPIHDSRFKLNITINNVQIQGLSSFTINDIAANMKSKKVSALLRMANVRIKMFYKVNGVVLEPKPTKIYQDKGKIALSVHGWRSVFAGKVLGIVNQDKLQMTGFGVRSHYNYFDPSIESFVYEPQSAELVDIGKIVSSNVIKKVVNCVDDKFENMLLDNLGIMEVGPWLNYKEKDEGFQREEDGQLLMMESKISVKSRQKRQVPCEVGEELDEYVDSLFRFLKRIIRVMEPFNLPNATVELEEYNLQIFLHSGMATRAYTFERKKPAWVLCQNETTTLGLTVVVEDARINYKYRVIQDWRLLFDGDLEAQLRRPKAQLQITQLSPPESEDEESDGEEEPQVQQRIDKLKVWKPGQINVLIRGLGNFSSALSMLINQMLSDTSMLDPIIRMIETDGVVAANELLKNISIPIFSII